MAEEAMRFAYADPPYLGRASYYKAHHPDVKKWDKIEAHAELITRLQNEYPDGWVMSLSEKSLRHILPLCPDDCRVAAWITDRARFAGKAVAVRKHFEPVIFRGGREHAETGNRTADFIVTQQEPMNNGQPRYIMCRRDIESGKIFVGRKPTKFALWVLDLLGVQNGDLIDDLFPGSGAVKRAWDTSPLINQPTKES